MLATMNTSQKSKTKRNMQKKKKNFHNVNVMNKLPAEVSIPNEKTLTDNYYASVMNPIFQCPPQVKIKKKVKKERRVLIVKENACPFMSQIHNLMISVLKQTERSNTWFTLTGNRNESAPKKIFFVVIPYLSHQTLVENVNKINTPFLATHQNAIRCSKSPIIKTDSTTCFILSSVLLADQSSKNIPPFATTTTQNNTTDFYKTKQYGLENLLISLDQFPTFSYPIKYENWRKKFKIEKSQLKSIQLKDITITRFTFEQCEMLEKDPNLRHLIAIDCEMCLTKNGREVVRISAVTPHVVRHTSINSATQEKKITLQMKFQVILDTFVKPSTPVLNYLSQYSGVYEDDLTGVTVTLNQVQKFLHNIITSKSILVGHSLENDLRCLQIFHPRVIDTSIAYAHPTPGIRHSLKSLAYMYLNKLIIHGKFSALDGHDSVEDAAVALELALLKSLPGDLTNRTPNDICPLSLCVKTPVYLYDSMIHDFSKHPLLSSSYKFEIPKIKPKTDFGVLQTFLETFKELKNKKKETQKPFPQLHLCFLRDYQTKLHTIIGGIPQEYRAHDVYNISKRISMLISTCLADLQSQKAMKMSDDCLRKNAGASDITLNWLAPFMNQTTSQTNSLVSEISPEQKSDTEDPLGTQWCHNLLKKRPIINNDVLFPPMNTTDVQNYFSTLDKYLFILNSHLSEGDLMIVSSVCGNPIPYMALSQLQNIISGLSLKKKLDLKAYIDPSLISLCKASEETAMKQPVTLCILK
ncbi:uncharacterized protein LOC128884199 [Hylaeus volcanicus]|uniref:uncharacterized protein LOC128884199 n=1 Tax=Hylaeus volcanicus TaxID=313075 RepID=UPI0023B8392E|nr:uncharacterized protein LOC128884199 [Hylaeus volcanicus]XP_053993350.1 uncharacterized protein LOC128884199 [Hylaeus volcanicus]